jgi:hypothetical protein
MNKSTFGNFIEKPRNLYIIDFLLVLPFLILPLLVNLPFRVNIFLSWEGAYRLSIGQVPFQDFGMPMGFGFWLIPALFFKIFGPTFATLVKAEVFINFLSLLALRGTLYNLRVKPLVISFALLVFALTYVIYNFWPWYNHTVVVFEMIAIYFLTRYDKDKSTTNNLVSIVLAGIFTFLTLYTKQDVGGICFLFSLFLLVYVMWKDNAWMPLVAYIASFGIMAVLLILPFADDGFFYWFNYGQPPHDSRVSLGALLDIVFAQSIVEKVYLILLVGGLLLTVPSLKAFFDNQKLFFVTAVCALMITQSMVTRVSSPLPTDHMTYFHAFGFVGAALFLPWERWKGSVVSIGLVLVIVGFIFSAGTWKYISGMIPSSPNVDTTATAEAEPVASPWVEGSLPTFKGVLIPVGTKEGIDRLMALPVMKKPGLKLLNMSELTPLAHECGFVPATGTPLWFHMNVGMFQKQVDDINKRLRDGYYDVVLFEHIESLPTFYPIAIQEELRRLYFRFDTFPAPRKLEDGTIEVFIRPDLADQFGLKGAGGLTTAVPE